MASVTLKNIEKIYDKEVVAVRDFTLEIADKEFVVFVGPSGCGKSTTLRMIAGLEEITQGDLYIGDTLMNNVASKDRDISMVFQNYALYPHMTVYDNMAFALKLRHERRSVIEQKVHEAAEILDISDLLKRKPKALSGGQRQRVAIGRAIVRSPQVFLMDEPLSNLDAKLRNQMRAEIIKLRRRINTTFVYVTHDQTEAMTLGDRIVVMKDGLMQQVGTPYEVFNHPENLFVAGFIGTPSMNLFNTNLTVRNERYFALFGQEELELPDQIQNLLRQSDTGARQVVLGVRPEHAVCCPPDTPGCVHATVEVMEMMGSSIYLHANVGGQELVITISTTDMAEHGKTAFDMGETIGFKFEGDTIHLFDSDTERNLFPDRHEPAEAEAGELESKDTEYSDIEV